MCGECNSKDRRLPLLLVYFTPLYPLPDLFDGFNVQISLTFIPLAATVVNVAPASAEQLRAAISDYLNIDTLTPLILNKLIEKIQVGHVEKVDGQMVQEITIVWRFAGAIS